MNKIKLGVIFGGMSTEHDISVMSADSIMKNLNKEKYDIYPVYINKEGIWYDNITKEEIENIFKYIRDLDLVFPVLHGLYGEDGTIQGLFEMLKVKYVGCKVLSSCLGMDKIYTKAIFEKAKIKQAKYCYIKKDKAKYILVKEDFEEEEYNIEELCVILENKLNFPMFVKPSNSGSSVGINKSNNLKELKEHIEYAFKYDRKVLVEENIKGKEIECSVIGNEDVYASCLGEIKSAEEFYSFNAKYKDETSKIVIPAPLNKSLTDEVRKQAVKAFKAIDGKGFARVDFFVNEETNNIYINEINTIPGFTKISMYPKLWENSGLSYSDLLDKLINLTIN